MNYSLENYCGDNYENLNINKLKKIYKNYYILEKMAENGDMTALCVKLDLEEAFKILTKQEYICITNVLIMGYTYREIAPKINRRKSTVENRIDNGLKKILHYIQTGRDL